MITKVDKTNEYRQLNAKKASLEKTLASLNDLKNKGGAISDFVSLHEKILEIETQIQELGVDLAITIQKMSSARCGFRCMREAGAEK